MPNLLSNRLTLKVKLIFVEEVLGTASSNPDIHRDFIASNAPDAKSREEEVDAIGVDGVIEKAMTIFPKEEGKPFFWNYQIKGFFKDACSALIRCPDTITFEGSRTNLKAYRKIIDGCIFVKPRKIFIEVNGKMGNCQRPLRASTAQGERVALANSETIPAGSSCEFNIMLLNTAYEKYVREWLEYGRLKGTGQWRNSGKGCFDTYYLTDKPKKARQKKQ